jgi:hypothetical protein
MSCSPYKAAREAKPRPRRVVIEIEECLLRDFDGWAGAAGLSTRAAAIRYVMQQSARGARDGATIPG